MPLEIQSEVMGNIPVGNATFQTGLEAVGGIHVVEIVASVDLGGADINIFRPHIDALESESVTETLRDIELPRVIDRIGIP